MTSALRFLKQGSKLDRFCIIISYVGVTAYSDIRGYYKKGNTFYFKMGLYRDRMPELMTIYMDEYNKKGITEQDK